MAQPHTYTKAQFHQDIENLDTPTQFPEGTVVNSYVIQKLITDHMLDNFKTFFPKGDPTPAELIALNGAMNDLCTKLVEMGVANRVNLEDKVTAKTKTLVAADPDNCELNLDGITYKMAYQMVKQSPEGTQTKVYTREEAINELGVEQFHKLWGTGDKGTHQMKHGDSTYWFSVHRQPVRETFDSSMTLEKDIHQGIRQQLHQHQAEQAAQSMEVPSKATPQNGLTQ